MEISTCCYDGCRAGYLASALPLLALLAIGVAARCAWLSRHAPTTPLHRVWGPWLAVPAAFALFLEYGFVGTGLALGPALTVLVVMVQVVFALTFAALPILTFVLPLQWIARRHARWSVTHRFAGAALVTELCWRGGALALASMG